MVRGPDNTAGPQGFFIAYPFDVSGRIHGAAILEIGAVPEQQVQAVLRGLHWGAVWFEVMVRREEAIQSQKEKEKLHGVLDAVAGVVEHGQFQASCTTFVTGLATKLRCDRVSVGLWAAAGE